MAVAHPVMMHMAAAKDMTAYSLDCGLWRTDGGFVSTIHVKNSLITAPLEITPAVFTPAGRKIMLPPVTIPAGGGAEVNINRALLSLLPPGTAPAFGSAEISYLWSSPGHIVASMQMLDVGRSLVFTAPFQPPQVYQPAGTLGAIPDPGPAPHRIEMLWWRHDPGVHDLLSLANTSAGELNLAYHLTGSSGQALPAQSLALGPHQSQLRDLSSQIAQLPPSLAASGGITITYTGTLGQLLVAGLLENDAEGYSDHMAYGIRDPNETVRTIRCAAPGILAGKPDPALRFSSSLRFFPYLVLRNATAASLDVRLTLSWPPEGSQDGTGDGTAPNQSYTLPMLRFAPGGSAQIPMQAFLRDAGIPGFDGSLNVLASSTGHGSDLIMAAGSVDASGSFVFATLPEETRKSFGRRESYWAIGNGYDTMITLWNTSPAAEDILIRLRYADGSGRYTLPVRLAPMSSQTVDLWQLIAAGRGDHKGRQFSLTEQNGSLSFESAKSHTTWLHLSADVAVYNPKNGTCSCYCDPCCAYTDFGVIPESLVIAVEGSQALDPYGCYCNGDRDSLDATLSSSDASIASVSGYDVSGVGPGQTTIGVLFAPVVQGGVNCYGAYDTSNCYSAPAQISPPPPATVFPVVTISCPAGVLVVGSGSGAYDTGETCTAVGNPAGGTFTWTVQGNTATVQLSSVSGGSATYTAVAQSRSVNDTDLQVTYSSNGEVSEPELEQITVRDPSSLNVVSDTGTVLDNDCTAGGYDCGPLRSILYQVADGLGAIQMESIPVAEVFTPGSDSCGGVPATPQATHGVTNASGDFPSADRLALCSTSCSTGQCPPAGSCQLTVSQTWTANGIAVRTNSLDYGCAKITVNGR